MSEDKDLKQSNFGKLTLATVGGIIILAGAVYASYRYSQSRSGDIVLPGGITYLGPSPTQGLTVQPTVNQMMFTAGSDVPLDVKHGQIYPYSFSYPSTLILVVFTDDLTDSVAVSWSDIPPQENILLNMEIVDKRDPKWVNQSKLEYVKIWYKFFPGLKGIANVDPFTNKNGLQGYKARYINNDDTTPSLDVFFEVPDDKNMMIHLNSGIIDPTIFEQMIDSVDWKAPSPTPIQPT